MQRSIFTLTKPVKDQEISWSMILNFVDFSGKRACIHPHANFLMIIEQEKRKEKAA
jgi:hypothetical protein